MNINIQKTQKTTEKPEVMEIVNKIGEFKQKHDKNDEMNILEVLREIAFKEDREVEEFYDILQDSDSFKTILKNDLINRGLLYIDGKRPKPEIENFEDW